MQPFAGSFDPMLTIRSATIDDIPLIRNLALEIWPVTYEKILGREQLHYMLEMIYSEESLRNQLVSLQHRFLICNENENKVGFASYSEVQDHIFKLHKVYILPSQQGRGTGRFIIDFITKEIKSIGAVALDLNLNRFNPARAFYEKLGFSILREEDIDIGNGYFMNDYVMRKKLFSGSEFYLLSIIGDPD